MKRYAKAALRKAAINTMAMIFLVALLPGCAVVGPLLSMGSAVGFAPLQYASTAYTVGEFSYAYAANDQDPGELIQEKIDNVLTGKIFELPDYLQLDMDDSDESAVMLAEADAVSGPPEGVMSSEARQRRIENLLGRRELQFNRLEHRRMAFLKARSNGDLSLRQTAMISDPDLFQGAVGEVSLD